MQPSLLTAALFTISAQPGTDIWRKPPSTDIFNAPTAHAQTAPLSTFLSASISFTANWTQRYDQAGMVLSLQRYTPDPSAPAPALASAPALPTPPKWVKTGIEYYQDQPRLSTVTCDAWADWSVAIPGGSSGGESGGETTLLARRETDELGTSLWVYQVVGGPDEPDADRLLPMRECAWFFAGSDDDLDSWALTVAAYAARPNTNTTDSLEVAFRDLTVLWKY